MWFVLAIVIVVIAGWIFLANSSSVTRSGDNSMDDRLPANPYDNPYDTKENNDRPFEPDNGDSACSSDVSDSSDDSNSGESSRD